MPLDAPTTMATSFILKSFVIRVFLSSLSRNRSALSVVDYDQNPGHSSDIKFNVARSSSNVVEKEFAKDDPDPGGWSVNC
jgi:hypothetical protein